MSPNDPNTELSEAQREIMEIVWDRGEVTASEVRQILGTRRPVARNTVRTLMERMESKGWLKHREDGRTHVYSATRNRKNSIGQKIVEVINQFCSGSAETMIAALIDYRGLKSAELKRIETLLNEAKKRKPSSKDES